MQLKNTYIFLFLMLTIISCDNQHKTDKNTSATHEPLNLIEISSPDDGIEVVEEKKLPYLVKFSDTTLLNSYTVTLNDQKLNSLTGEVDLAPLSLGEHTLRVKARLKDGRVEVKSVTFLKLSDIAPVEMTYRVKETFNHLQKDYTQGLEIVDGKVYEGTGMRGESVLKVWDLKTSKIMKEVALEDQYFGEGITVLKDKIYQLTWQSHLGFVYDKKNLNRLASFSYPQEGWGLTNDGENLIMSDGSNVLTFFSPLTFDKIKEIQVFDDLTGVYDLNELEYVKGEIYANVYRTNMVVVIDPVSGKVKRRIDFTGLLDNVKVEKEVDVLNGIAYDQATEKLYVTGKWWPTLFEVELLTK